MHTRILLVDDHAIVIDGLEAILQTEPSYKVVGKVTDARLGLSYLKSMAIDLVITDYSMPEVDGLSFLSQVKRDFPTVKVLILSMHDEPHLVKEILKAGADGYVLKKYAQQEIFHAIQTVLNDRQYWSPEVSRALLRIADEPDDAPGNLTAREVEVLRLLVDQLSSKEIAEKLFIGERTVETHRKNLMRKTGSSNTAGLVRYAFERKIV